MTRRRLRRERVRYNRDRRYWLQRFKFMGILEPNTWPQWRLSRLDSNQHLPD